MITPGFEVKTDDTQLKAAVAGFIALGRSPRAMLRDIATAGENQTRARFRTQTAPDGSTWKQSMRAKLRGGKTLTLAGHLSGSISSQTTADTAEWGVNRVYAAIHQFGGEIRKPAFSSWRRLRTTARGTLLRQKDHKNLAVFAKDSHKRAVKRRFTVSEHVIDMPARPFLGVNDQDASEFLDIIAAHISRVTDAR